MENEKTIWNKTIFSESPHKYDDNFQIMNMQYKLKNSKKKRKENYKNIELLENIYDNTEENIEGFKNKKKTKKNKGASYKTNGYSEVYTNADSVGYGNLQESNKSEGFDPNFLGLPDKYFDGVDTPDKGNKDDPRVALIRSINNMFGVINEFNYKIALVIAKTLSRSGKGEDDFAELLRKGSNTRRTQQDKSYSTNDVFLIQKYIGFFESILVAFFATYNWFYIMFYYYTSSDKKTDEEGNDLTGKRQNVPKLSSFYIQDQIHNRGDFLSMFYSFINIFFIFALAFVEYLQSIMMDIIPKYTKKIFNYKGCFVAVFFMLIMFFYYFNDALYNFLIDVLSGNTKNVMVGFMYFFLILIYFFGNYNFGYISKTPAYTAHTFMDFIISPLFSFIMAFIRFIIIMLISVPFGGIACILYILFNSFFGILFNTGIMKFFGTFFRINDFIKDNNDPEANKPKSNEDEFIYKLKSSYNKVIDFIYKYAIFISYVILLTIAIFDYLKNIKNYKLKLHLIILSAIFILIMLVSMLGIFFYEKEETINPTTPLPDESEKTKSMFDIFSSVAGSLTGKIPGLDPSKLGIDPSKLGIDPSKLGIDPSKLGDINKLYNTANDNISSLQNVSDITNNIKLPYNTMNDVSNSMSNVTSDLTKNVTNIIPNNATETITNIAKNTPTGVAVNTAYNTAKTAANTGKNILSKASGMMPNILPKQKPKITTFSAE
jgi:hypothetical protein